MIHDARVARDRRGFHANGWRAMTKIQKQFTHAACDLNASPDHRSFVTIDKTSSAIARQDVSPGDSIPYRLTIPITP